ncbi:NAD(P)/FAD-dependent oxidoreductase [uncultured Jatrophihabitans sp.]|uniref:NAD(P)/FAD-dependent oxidoreductase n=1 Tax=uncultured Jatrophihabitans sp. TaxID=1610747 RepID=UPI0035CAE9CE
MTRIVVVGAGFAGYYAAKRLTDRVDAGTEVVVINPHDYFLYVPLLPQVMSGVVEPRRLTVSLAGTLPGVRYVAGTVTGIDLDARTVAYEMLDGGSQQLGYDQVVVTSGSVTKLLPIPGVASHALGFRDLAEAVFLRDHLIRQIELADETDDSVERDARLTFVVVGAGYTGTEVAAQGARLTRRLLRRHPRLAEHNARWMLLDTAPNVLPGLRPRLGRSAAKALKRLGVDVRMRTSVKEATRDGVQLTDGSTVPTRSLVWCVGVRPDPLVSALGLETDHGRLKVSADLGVPGHADAWACGDSAAVPDLTKPGQVTAMTAQHAQRQGTHVADNILAVLAGRPSTPYEHHDLGFVVDLGGTSAAADPLGVPLGGWPAALVTRGYHLLAMPGNRLRTVLDWLAHALLGPQEAQLQLVARPDLPMDTSAPLEGGKDSAGQ